MQNGRHETWVILGLWGLLWGGCNNSAQQAIQDAGLAGRGVPKAVSALGLSRHYVEVTFAAPAGAEAVRPERYRILKSGGGELRVDAVMPAEVARQVILTTEAQQETAEYVLTIYDGNLDEAPVQEAPGLSPDEGGITFFGAGGLEPRLLSAISLSNTTVLLTFSVQMDRPLAQNKNFYDISNPELGITLAALAADNLSLTLTTTSQENIEYMVRATNVRSTITYGGYFIDPEHSTAEFYGIPVNDTVRPRLVGAEAVSETSVLLSFSEPVKPNAADPTNYSTVPALVIISAQQNLYQTQVLLTTLPMNDGQAYTITASAYIKDLATPGNAIDPAFNSRTFTFTGAAGLGGEGDPASYLPRLTGAISTSNRTVVVSYNKPMSDSAINPANYFIIQENQQPEAGYLQVTDAVFLGNSRTTVQLATLSQSEVTYHLTVVNVEDMQGNQIAPKELLVDPATVLFPGTPPSCLPPKCAADSGNPDGTDGDGACESDDDCDDNAPCNSAEVDCEGKCERRCELDDTDGDGLTDDEEQRGWVAIFEQATKRGEHDERVIVMRDVTSNPLLPDTDADGLDDALEKLLDCDPRNTDTDDDLVPDATEYNVYYSNPADQDSDDDDTDDFLEIDFFRTSPIMADTDGDGMNDSEEIYERSRNPLIADLPLPQITVGDIALDLKITSSFTDEEGTTRRVEDTRSTSFSQSQTNTLGFSDTRTTQSENEFGQEIGAEGGTAGWKVTGKVTFGQSRAQGFSSTVDKESSETSQQEYQESVTHALEMSENRSVTRTIDEAIVQATVNIANKSDLAFSITNIELSLLQQDRLAGLTFRPIATLRPTGAADPTSQPTFNLGPFAPERGPIIFENTTVFPNRVDALMREPVGLIFEVANFDVTDEFGRNFVFTSQDVNDRTVDLTIDFGDGRVEFYHVATASVFGDDGRMIGITMQRALEIVGITQAMGMSPDIAHTYETMQDSRMVGMDTVMVEALVRVRDVENTMDGKKFWTAVSSNTDLDPNSDFSIIPLHAHETILVMYTSDEDEDGLFLREEYLYGSLDTDTDSDDDTLGDFFEVRTGWTVKKVPGLPYKAFPSPARPDSDLDGLDDAGEMTAMTDPNRVDTDEDGLSDPSELQDTYEIVLFDGDVDITNNKVLTVAPYSDWAITAGMDGTCDTTPTGDDTAVTQHGMGSKLCVASGPNGVIDTTPADDDEVVAAPKIDAGPDGVCQTTTQMGDDVEEFDDDGDDEATAKGSIGKVCVSAGLNDVLDTMPAAGSDDFVRVVHMGLFGTDPVRFDTDLDGIGDGREGILGINPNRKDAGSVTDTDGDGLFDDEEEAGWAVAGYVGMIPSNKNRPDTDFDGIPDVLERAIGSHPNRLDTDGDTLLDYLEFDKNNPVVNGMPLYNSVVLATALVQCEAAPNCAYFAPDPGDLIGTNPAAADTDGDTRDDNVEVQVSWNVDTFEADPDPVTSDPLEADADGDGLNDAAEFTAGTHPEDADTDGDDGSDSYEGTVLRNPLRQDRKITLDVNSLFVNGDCDPGGAGGEFEGLVFIQYPDGSTQQLENIDNDCDEEDDVDEGEKCSALNDTGNVVFFVFGTQQTGFRLFSSNIEEDDDTDDENPDEFDVSFTYPVSAPTSSVQVSDPAEDPGSCTLTFMWSISVQ